uniref:UDP-glycosyltransferase 83A1-like n=1 Tax=Fragaria vesca subsp. vesca TaxID=101020 RepID=UPI0005C89FDF|nr:PREDICTED: UDP-glycosyltransferase 83A1-like [Fragaria vesca subsp. vesca]
MVTFVITEFAHARLMAAEPDLDNERNKVRYIAVPDGLSEDDARNDEADPMFGWALEIAEMLKLKLAIFWTSAPGVLALILNIPKLIEDGIIDAKGSSKIDGKVQLSTDLPPLTSADFLWNYSGKQSGETNFQYFSGIQRNMKRCGWLLCNCMGVPFLCWPYFADQFYNRSCICNGYKVGLALSPDEYGIVTRHEIRRKLDSLVADDGIRANALKLKEMALQSISEGGSSAKNLDNFISQMKQ